MRAHSHSRGLLAAALCAAALGAWGFDVETLERGVFRIEYLAGSRVLAEETAAELEAMQQACAERLPIGGAPICVVICGTPEMFAYYARRLNHVNVEGVAQSRAGVIAVKAPDLRKQRYDYKGTLRHELVHVLLARNTDTAVLPKWLNEGIAMRVGGDFRWDNLLQVGEMYVRGRIIPLYQLDFAFVAPQSGEQFGDAYAQALSMTKHLECILGEEGFWDLVYAMNQDDFTAVLKAQAGMTPAEFFASWKRSLWKFALIFGLVSGLSIFQLGALLLVLAYWRRRRRGRRVLAQWDAEEREHDSGPEILFAWQLEGLDAPAPWEEDDEEY